MSNPSLREKLGGLTKEVSSEHRRELEKLFFELQHSRQVAHKLEQEARQGMEIVKEHLALTKRQLEEAQTEIGKLQDRIRGKEFNTVEVIAQKNEIEKNMDKLTNPVIDLDNLNVDLFKLVGNTPMTLKNLNTSIREMLQNVASKMGDSELLQAVNKLSETQITVLVHIGFSELHFFRALTGQDSMHPVHFSYKGRMLG